MDESPTPTTNGAEDPSGGRRRRPALVVVLVALGLVVLLALFTDIPTGTIIGAVVLGVVIFSVGWFLLRQFATPPPPPPDPGTMRRVRLTYRCPVCGAEVRMTAAPSEDPEPPRHCMEDMELVNSEE